MKTLRIRTSRPRSMVITANDEERQYLEPEPNLDDMYIPGVKPNAPLHKVITKRIARYRRTQPGLYNRIMMQD